MSLGKERERQDGPREGSEEHTSRRGRRPKLAAAQSITWNRASRLACAAPTFVNSIFLFISTIGSERCAHMQLACGSLGSWSAGPSSWPFAGPHMWRSRRHARPPLQGFAHDSTHRRRGGGACVAARCGFGPGINLLIRVTLPQAVRKQRARTLQAQEYMIGRDKWLVI